MKTWICLKGGKQGIIELFEKIQMDLISERKRDRKNGCTFIKKFK